MVASAGVDDVVEIIVQSANENVDDAAGIAERKIKKKHDIGDKAIKSTHEGKCKR